MKKWLKENFLLWSSPMMERAYQGSNYRERLLNDSSDICLIFFSSNGLYSPNLRTVFEQTILQEDRYEWENQCSDARIGAYAGKAIFVRDIYKQWYVRGISQRYNSIDALTELLLGLTKGYRVITVGCSSGGYAAVLFGIKLGAAKIYSFSGQFSIDCIVDEYYWLSKYKGDASRSRYYSLADVLGENQGTPIYYFYPANCEQDVGQYEIVKGRPHLYEFAVNSSQHGETIRRENYISMMIMPDQEIEELQRRYQGRLIEKDSFLQNKS